MAIRKVLAPSLSMPWRCENSVAARNAICEAGEASLTTLFHLTHRMHALMFPSVLPAFASSSLNTTNFGNEGTCSGGLSLSLAITQADRRMNSLQQSCQSLIWYN
jgi:hypothetical protein